MRRSVRSLVSVCIVLGTTALGAAPARATPATPHAVAGVYTVHVKWHGWKWQAFDLTLNRDHSGIDSEGAPATWSLANRTITVEVNGGDVLADYVGEKVATGFNSRTQPARVSNTEGNKGIWYAVRASG